MQVMLEKHAKGRLSACVTLVFCKGIGTGGLNGRCVYGEDITVLRSFQWLNIDQTSRVDIERPTRQVLEYYLEKTTTKEIVPCIHLNVVSPYAYIKVKIKDEHFQKLEMCNTAEISVLT